MKGPGKPRVEGGFQRQTVNPSSQETEQMQRLLLLALAFLDALEVLVRELIQLSKAERSNLGHDKAHIRSKTVKLRSSYCAFTCSHLFLLCRRHKFTIILQTSHTGGPLSFEVVLFRQHKCQLPVISIIIYTELLRSEGETMQAAHFCLVSSQERSAELFKTDTLSKQNHLPKSALPKERKKGHA